MRSLYTEKDIQEIWEGQRFRREGLLTEEALPLAVEFPGLRWGEGGPDFRGARIVLGGERRLGDVEIHLVPSGWKAHGHDRDGAYAGVILHVVLRRDSFLDPPRGIPLLVLEPYLHGPVVPSGGEAADDLDLLGEEWFVERRSRLLRALERSTPDETLYREILIALGYKYNKAAMAALGRACPLESLAEPIEARLREAANRLPQGMWRLRNVRPANHPWRRLAGMARFLAATRKEGLARGLAARATLGEMTAWLDPDGMGQIGPARALEIAINVFVPFLGKAAWRLVADGPPPTARPGLLDRRLADRVTTVRKYFGALRLLKGMCPAGDSVSPCSSPGTVLDLPVRGPCHVGAGSSARI
jgi:hypothetical protein